MNDEQEFRAAAADYRLTTELTRLTDTVTEMRRPAGLRPTTTLRITTERVAKDGASVKVGLAFNPARSAVSAVRSSR